MRVLALETFDEAGQLRSDGAGLSAVLARLGSQCLETAVAIAQRPIEQRIDGNCCSFRMRDVVGAGGDLLGAAREFAAGKAFNKQEARLMQNRRAFHRSRSYIQFNQPQTQEYRVEMYPGVICSAVHAATRCAFAITTLHPGSNLKNLVYEEGKKRGSLQNFSNCSEPQQSFYNPRSSRSCTKRLEMHPIRCAL